MIPLRKYKSTTPPKEVGHTWLMRHYGQVDMAMKAMFLLVLFLALEI